MHKEQLGFTLIELMLVVAIIGILAAVSLPAYQDYTRRAHVSEGLMLANDAKIAITEYYSTFNIFPTDNAEVGIPAASQINGNAVDSIAVSNNTITITYNNKVSAGASIILEGDVTSGSSVEWSCDQGTLPGEYRPSGCR